MKLRSPLSDLRSLCVLLLPGRYVSAGPLHRMLRVIVLQTAPDPVGTSPAQDRLRLIELDSRDTSARCAHIMKRSHIEKMQSNRNVVRRDAKIDSEKYNAHRQDHLVNE
jgi:hypothetical protein